MSRKRRKNKNVPNDDFDKNTLKDKNEDIRYRLRNLAKIRNNQQFYTELKVIQNVKKRLVFVKNILVKGKQFVWTTTVKFVEPNVVISVFTAIYFYRKSHQLEIELTQQQRQIEIIERNLEQSPKGSVKSFFKDNWPKILISGGTIIVPVGKQIYNHWQTKQELVVAKGELFETKDYLTETQGKLTQTQGELTKTESQLTEAKSEIIQAIEEISKVKIDSEITLSEINQETQVKISKLHVTLTRFNEAAMYSAQQETKMRSEIFQCRNLLADTLQIRDDLKETVKYYVNLTNQKSIELEDNFLETQVLKATLKDKLVSQARLKVDLDQAKISNEFSFFKIKKLEKQINNFDKERINLRDKLSEKISQCNELELKKQKIQLEYEVDQKKQAKNEQEIENLKLKNKQNDTLLQKSIDETNRCALKMDQAQDKIDQFQEMNLNNEQKTELLNQKIKEQNKLISHKKNKIIELDQKNEQLEYSIADMKNRLNKSRIETEELNCDIAKVKKAFNEASGQEKRELNNLINEKQKAVDKYQKINSKLQSDMVKEGHKLAQSYISQDGLIKEADKLKRDSRVQEKDFFSRLQSERKCQDEKFELATNTAAQLIEQVLNKQESDRDKSWWSKLPIHFQFKINAEPKSEPKTEMHREHFFYSGPGNEQTLTQRVVEKFNHKTGKFEIIKDKLEVIE
jgi:hypothetical protein